MAAIMGIPASVDVTPALLHATCPKQVASKILVTVSLAVRRVRLITLAEDTPNLHLLPSNVAGIAREHQLHGGLSASQIQRVVDQKAVPLRRTGERNVPVPELSLSGGRRRSTDSSRQVRFKENIAHAINRPGRHGHQQRGESSL